MKKYREQKKIPPILALKKLGRYRKLSRERKPESLTNKGLSGGDVSKGDKLISKKGKEIARPTPSNKGRGSEGAVDGVTTKSAQKKNASRASESGRESPTTSSM